MYLRIFFLFNSLRMLTQGRPTLFSEPTFHLGSFSAATAADTFLAMTGWEKGMVWINGHNLGR